MTPALRTFSSLVPPRLPALPAMPRHPAHPPRPRPPETRPCSELSHATEETAG